MSALGKLIDLKDLTTGDLVFFKGHNPAATSIGHVALVIDAGIDFISIIHATCHKGVIIENLKSSEYFLKRYVLSKRIF
jgi:cell wall-associated NlpC family hydrolase